MRAASSSHWRSRMGDGARREDWIRTLAARDADREKEIDEQAKRPAGT